MACTARQVANLLGPRPRCYVPAVVAVGGATAAAVALAATGSTSFERLLGPLPPAATVAATGAIGVGALRFLESRGFWRAASRSRTTRGLAVATLVTLPFAAVAIGVDVAFGFGQDMNVAWPRAWLFYPAIAVVAEAVFHLLPLAALLRLTRWRFADQALDRRAASLILATAAVEPAVQVALGSSLPVFVVPHVYVFGVVQLVLLRRYGYLPMLWFRIMYYLLWHVLWGQARLELLF